jgi:hypothetical protein
MSIATTASLIIGLAVALTVLGIVAQLVIGLGTLIVVWRSGGPHALLSYFFNPVEYRERQREKIRAGFRKSRRRRTHRD